MERAINVRASSARRSPRRCRRFDSVPSMEAPKNKSKVSVAEIATAVQAAGYKSKSQDFQNLVSITLSQGKKWFRRVRRGSMS